VLTRTSTRSSAPPRALVVALLGLLGFLALVAIVLVHPDPLPLDRFLHDAALEHRGSIADLAKVITALGSMPVVLPVLVLSGVVWAWRGPRAGAGRWLLVLVAPLLLFAGQFVRYTSMLVLDRPRPPSQDWLVFASGQSFPSGHTTTSAIGFGLSAVLLALALRPGALRSALTCLLLGVAALVGTSRVALGVHWPTDVLGGWCLALCVVSLSALLLTRLDRRVAPQAARVPAGVSV
jgi:membrane-associated phospholipid phosphatase